jgi:Skp family chaperone for outer membrane proteins
MIEKRIEELQKKQAHLKAKEKQLQTQLLKAIYSQSRYAK